MNGIFIIRKITRCITQNSSRETFTRNRINNTAMNRGNTKLEAKATLLYIMVGVNKEWQYYFSGLIPIIGGMEMDKITEFLQTIKHQNIRMLKDKFMLDLHFSWFLSTIILVSNIIPNIQLAIS
jgi:hypothetical protein